MPTRAGRRFGRNGSGNQPGWISHRLMPASTRSASPVARDGLLKRRVPVIYCDVAHRDTLVHAGVDKAEVLISTVPDSLLKGTTNARLVRFLRELNPTAKIIATADVLAQARELLNPGADYVNVPRLHQAGDLLEAVRAAREGLLDEKRATLREILLDRREVLA